MSTVHYFAVLTAAVLGSVSITAQQRGARHRPHRR